jgi:hypothetical protein
MDAMNIEEVKNKLQTYKEYSTYVYVRTNTSNYNGYICSVDKDAFMFKDDILNIPFPIRFDELKFMPVPSNKKGSDFNYGRRCDGNN